MEVRLETLPTTSGSDPGITGGDIFVIEEPNYFTNATSPIIYENDFQAKKMAVATNEQGVKDHIKKVESYSIDGKKVNKQEFDDYSKKMESKV